MLFQNKKKGAWLAALTLVFLLTLPAAAQEQKPLLAPALSFDSSVAAKAEKAAQQPYVVRSRLVTLNLDYALDRDVPPGDESLLLNLFEDVKLTAVKDRLEQRSPEQYVWFGWVKDEEYSQVIMVVDQGSVAANITLRDRRYQVRPVEGEIHAVREIDQSAFLPERPPIRIELPAAEEDEEPTSGLDSGGIIEIMVVYTADAAAASGGIAAEIALAVAETNESYANSGIAQRVRLVRSSEVDYEETGDMGEDLTRLQDDGDGYIDQVHTWRDDSGADVVVMLVENGDACGIGYHMVTVTTQFAPYAFSVVQRNCATGYYSFGHEMGHNMGAGHDCYVDDSLQPYEYAHGYVYKPDRWRTIMAYNSECEDAGFDCDRIQYWSNPSQTYGGVAMGKDGAECLADNQQTLDNTAPTVANFESSTGTTTTTGASGGGGGGGGGGCFLSQALADWFLSD